jgi:hypothetical protein
MKPAIALGEILLEDYLVPMGISQNALARALGINPRSINEILVAAASRPKCRSNSGNSSNKAPSSGSTSKINACP